MAALKTIIVSVGEEWKRLAASTSDGFIHFHHAGGITVY
jgi:hypothetical protein